MARYRHFKNKGEPGQSVFLTTTVIDFAPIFRRPDLANRMERLILDYCRKQEAVLHCYVVMHHHIHLLLRLPIDTSVDRFMRTFKSKASLAILPLLSQNDHQMLSQQTGLNDRKLWKRSYRSFVIETPYVFNQKILYTHSNPVRSGFCELPEQHSWSSARWWAEGLWSDESGLDIEQISKRLEG